MLIGDFGGRWHRGGDVGQFAPCQLVFADGMKIELLQPGTSGTGFVTRFLERGGSGPHHLTFKVEDLDRFIEGCRDFGFEVLPAFLEIPGRRESFVHPKQSGFGTLLQAIENEERYEQPGNPPPGVPVSPRYPCAIAWVALTVSDVDLSTRFFVEVLDGSVTSGAVAEGTDSSGWRLVEWAPGRRLLVMSHDLAPRTRPGAAVDHLLIVDAGQPLPDPGTMLTHPTHSVLPDAALGVRLVDLRISSPPTPAATATARMRRT